MQELKILFIGDIVGKLGRDACREMIPKLDKELTPHFIIANAENAAHGYSITVKIYQELLDMGVDAITMGNHIWDKKEMVTEIDKLPLIVRPANYPPGAPGKGYLFLEKEGVKLAVANLAGRVFMQALDCPFQAIEKILPAMQKETSNILVDMHAETTSEKCAMGWFLNGKVSAVLGTHTHVLTADERILPGGTAFISDVGMAGPYDSIIGMKKEQILKRFTTQLPEKFSPTEEGPTLFNAVFLKIDTATGKAKEIKRVSKVVGELSS